MLLKKKTRIWPFLAAALAVLLCLGIQLALASYARWSGYVRAGRTLTGLSAGMTQAAREQELLEDQRQREQAEKCRQGLSAKLEAAQTEDILVLVNAWNPIPEGYEVQLTEIGDGHEMDSRCAKALLTMLEDCRAAGCWPYVASTYRTEEYQQKLYDDKIERVRLDGYSPAEAPRIAAQSVAVPGTSEHQLGLAVDILDNWYPRMNTNQETTVTQRWLIANCWRYGFILRYPNGTTDITGIVYEPWHYRYVGLDAAREITESGVTLEEYLELRRAVQNS